MLMVLKPGREAMAEAIFHKWELDFAVIGEVTDTGRMVLDHQGETVCDIPLSPLADDAPCSDRPHIATPKRETLKDVPENTDNAPDQLKPMGSPYIASPRRIGGKDYHMVWANPSTRRGGDAADVRGHGTRRGNAINTRAEEQSE